MSRLTALFRLGAAILVLAIAGCDMTEQPPPVLTYSGSLQGSWADDEQPIRVFRGIPYARPPIEERRWRAPEAPPIWDGVRQATAFAPACFQPEDQDAFVWSRRGVQRSEDCLYLNIWADEGADKAPVMVWFHGGAHQVGMGHEAIFDGTALARRDVVVVTINYRLGPLGFLAHPWLAEESSHDSAGNYGLLDKVAALNWVHDNIEQFGGDARNVTIFGQSAGSASVCALMASPLARGLFHKAIGQSASCFNTAKEDQNGLQRGADLVARLGVQDIDSLREVPPSLLLDAATVSGWTNHSALVIDGWALREPPEQTFRRGEHHAVPLLVGSTANEGVELFPVPEINDDDLNALLKKRYGEQAQQLKQLYSESDGASPGHIAHAIATDAFMGFSMRRWAGYNKQQNAPTYLYFLQHAAPAFHLYQPNDPDMHLPDGPRSPGAYHSSDLALVFANTHRVGRPWNDSDHTLADAMSRYWTEFARYGDPNVDGLPSWPGYELERHTTQILSEDIRSVAGARRAKLDALAAAFNAQSNAVN